MRAAPAIFYVAVALFALACSKPEPPTITPKSGTVTAVTPAGVDMKLSIEAANPNGFDIDARSVTAKLTVDKTPLGTITTPSAVSIPAHGSSTFDVPVSVPWNDLAALATLATSTADLPYKLDGTVTIGSAKLNVDVPFHLEGKIPHDQLVKATMSSIPKIPGLPLPFTPPAKK